MTEPLIDRALPVLRAVAAEDRPAQVAALRAITWSMENAHQLELEAPTATGKSFPNLIAAALHEGTVIVSTGTKALQDQYQRNDVPRVAAALADLGIVADFAVMKGRKNYACLAAVNSEITDDDGRLISVRTDTEGIARAIEWARTTEDGDWANAPFDVTPAIREQLSVTADQCLRKRCPYFLDCHAERAYERAREADVVIVNHALLAAHAASDGRVLPPHTAIIVDEWHEMERAAEGAFGSEMNFRYRNGEMFGTLRTTANRMRKLVSAAHPDAYETTTVAAQGVEDAGAMLDAAIALRLMDEQHGRDIVLSPLDMVETFREPLEQLRAALAAADDAVVNLEPGADGRVGRFLEWNRARAATSNGFAMVDSLLSFGAQTGHVAYVSTNAARDMRVIRFVTVDVGPTLRSVLWTDATNAPIPVIATSATISTGYGPRLGLDGSFVQLPATLPNADRSLVYVADDLPVPTWRNRPEWEPLAVERAIRMADASLAGGGGVLVLCTSFPQVRQFAAGMRRLLRTHPTADLIVDDGTTDTSREQIMARLRSARLPLAVGTLASWGVGLDLPGKLHAVILPTIPYTPPGSPVNEARKRLRPSSDIPHPMDRANAAATWGQAAGRLMRCRTDWGAVVVLDPRLTSSQYAAELQSKMPSGASIHGASMTDPVVAWLRTGGPDRKTVAVR